MNQSSLTRGAGPRAESRVRADLPTVVIVAEGASARFGGQAILPLHYFRLLRARDVDAYLVVPERTREELEQTLPDDSERIFYVEDLLLQQLLWSACRLLPARVALHSIGTAMHLLTQMRQRRIVRRLVEQRGVEVVHEATPVSPKVPSMMFGLGVPVIIGPLNGGMDFPPGFEARQDRGERLFMWGARGLSHLAHRVIPGKRKAARILVSNPRTRNALPRGACKDIAELVENGVDLELFSARTRRDRDPEAPCRFVYLGRLVDWKGVDILLDAFARASQRTNMVLDVVGEGQESSALQEQARRLGLEQKVTFHGFVPQTECPDLLARADALVLTSLYECGGAVVLEAMAMGLPVIAPAWGGPMDYLDDETGRLVDPCGGRRIFQRRIEEALVELAEDRDLREQLGKRGAEKVREAFDWQQKIDAVLQHYDDVRARPDPQEAVEKPAVQVTDRALIAVEEWLTQPFLRPGSPLSRRRASGPSREAA